jgi:hypothetical protein
MCFARMAGWIVAPDTARLCRPRKEVLDGTWKFTEAVAVTP